MRAANRTQRNVRLKATYFANGGQRKLGRVFDFANGGKVGKTPMGLIYAQFHCTIQSPPDPITRDALLFCWQFIIGAGKRQDTFSFPRPLPLCPVQIASEYQRLKLRLVPAVVAVVAGSARTSSEIGNREARIKQGMRIPGLQPSASGCKPEEEAQGSAARNSRREFRAEADFAATRRSVGLFHGNKIGAPTQGAP